MKKNRLDTTGTYDTSGQIKVQVKCTLAQALRLCTGSTAHRGRRGIALLFLDHGTRRAWGVSVTSRSLPPGKIRYPMYRRLGGPQGRSGQVRKISPPPGFDPRTVRLVASRYTDYATRPTLGIYFLANFTLQRKLRLHTVRRKFLFFFSNQRFTVSRL